MESALSIELQVSLLLFLALAGYLLASRINQSATIGAILVGILVGPSVLGLITYTDFVASLAHMGAIILLFAIGFEFSLKDILTLRNGVISFFGVVVPWAGGYAVAVLFGFDFATAVFVGTALTATSTAITANVLKEIGMLQTAAAKAIIGAAVIDDILSLLALSVTLDLVTGEVALGSLIQTIAIALAFVAVAGTVGVLVVRRFIHRMEASTLTKQYPGFVFIFALMLAFFYAMIADLIGLSGIIGAFLAGIAFSDLELRQSKSVKLGAEYFEIVFASIFFISLGILVDIQALTSEIALFVAVLTVVALATKIVGCGLPARLMGMCREDSLIVGFGMAARGEVTMIIALIGLNAGFIDQGIFVACILMSLLTTLITPIVYRNWFFKGAYCATE
jgi:Kef-type K+ transport system membrane component KefB